MKIILLKEHTHEGAVLSVGETLEVSDQVGTWLVAIGSAKNYKTFEKSEADEALEQPQEGDTNV